MAEKTEKVSPERYSVNVKMNAKRELYGEYTVKADTLEELEKDLTAVSTLFRRHIGYTFT